MGQTIGVRLLALDENANIDERYLKAQDGYELLTFSSRQASQLIDTYVDEGKMLLYEKTPSEKETPSYRVADKITLPAGAKNILILALGGGDENAYLAIDDNFLDANYNTWMVINTASKPVSIQVGKVEKPLIIEVNCSKIYKVDAAAGAGTAVLAQAKWKGEMKTFYSTYWAIREGERPIVIFVEKENRIVVKKISDKLPDK